jgi:carbohydrate diacid regulator
MDLTRSAQEMVEAIAPIVSGRTVNVMDTNAIIIASSELSRIGTFHQGAAEAIKKKKPVWIYKKDVAKYPGAKEGINLPIILDGRLVGVVGIYGEPDSVKDVANLLCVYVKQYFTAVALASAEHTRNSLRTDLLRMLMHGSSENEVVQMCKVLGVSVKMPMKAIAVSLKDDEADVINKGELLERIPDILLKAGCIDPDRDIYGVADEFFICFKSTVKVADFVAFLQKVHSNVCSILENKISVASGEECVNLSELRYSAYEAKLLAAKNIGCSCMDSNRTKMELVFYTLHEIGNIRFPEKLYDVFIKRFNKNSERMLSTIESYHNCSGNALAAAKQLGIHKNTLLYRMKVIFNALDLEKDDSFTKDFFLDLLLTYHSHAKRNKRI